MKLNHTDADMEDQWEGMRRGDAAAMLVLYEHNYSDLLSYGVQLSNSTDTAKDAINDVFLQLWEQRAKLKPVKNTKAYLFACIRRKIFHPAYTDNKMLLLTEKAFYESAETSYEDVLIAMQQSEETRKKVQAALEKLTARQKELIHLKYFKNMGYQEIELATGISVKTAYNTIYNAVKALANELRTMALTLLLPVLFFL
ncbi:MAG: sigma-70 family RNA polymerase sigma factor [Chitinophagaceae bacterium]|nr:sigma-70 family RNA polymerase sigma factor [Chitinophagaceae bacterium]